MFMKHLNSALTSNLTFSFQEGFIPPEIFI